MAYSLLTDAKTIIGLGSRRSILGTIIRPDPVLLDRKGGNNGELTFANLLPGADEPIPQQFGNGSSDVYSWQLLDEEPLPREKILADDDCLLSPTKRRALLRADKRRLRKTDSGEASKSRNEVNGVASRGTDAKKKRRKEFLADDDRLSRSLPRNWSRSH